jgi:glycosyltransferase involved in cell wall biosynthesis
MYERAAREAGLTPVTWFDDSSIPDADVYHAFNVGRPLDLYPKLVQIKRWGHPFVLSTIHNRHEWVTRYRRSDPPAGRLGKVLFRTAIGRSVPVTETLREVAMVAQEGRLARLVDLLPSWITRVRWLLEKADRIALLSREEGVYVGNDYAYTMRPEQALIVPNWVEGLDEISPEMPAIFEDLPESPVLVVGRIEPLKNSLRICRLAERARRHVVFIGRPLHEDSTFCAAFEAEIRRSRYCRWIRGVPRSTLASFYRHGSFLLTASYGEVSPLVDIEALAWGCPVATTKYAVHHEWLPPDTPICDPYDDASILERLAWRPHRLSPRHVVDRDASAAALVRAYRDLARSSRCRPASMGSSGDVTG